MDKLIEQDRPSKKPEDWEDPGKNASRADWAQTAVQAFQNETGTDAEDAISDLIGDLMHLCDRVQGTSFKKELARGRAHYEYEICKTWEKENKK